jgi:hypothetical protein
MQAPDVFAVYRGAEGRWCVLVPEADPRMPAVRVVAVLKPNSSIHALQLLRRVGLRRARKKHHAHNPRAL